MQTIEIRNIFYYNKNVFGNCCVIARWLYHLACARCEVYFCNFDGNQCKMMYIFLGDPQGLPKDAQILMIHKMRNFDIYGSHNGAWKYEYGKSHVERVPGIDGHVISCVVTDKFFRGDYNIYIEKSVSRGHHEFYTLKDGQNVAKKIQGLPDYVKMLAIHNLGGVNFFGSCNGAYKLVQGELTATRVPHVHGPVRKVTLGGSPFPDDATFQENI